MKYEHKVISGRYIEQLVEALNQHGLDGYHVVGTIQEQGLVKLLLEREGK